MRWHYGHHRFEARTNAGGSRSIQLNRWFLYFAIRRRRFLAAAATLSGTFAAPLRLAAKSRVQLTPEMFCGVGYPDAASAMTGIDSTRAVQAMADFAAAHRQPCGGREGMWYKVGTVAWPSHSDVHNLALLFRGGSEDGAPYTIDATNSPRHDLRFTDCSVHGNRLNQQDLRTSGGDGQRFGWALRAGFPDAISRVTLIRCKAWHCATDGFFTTCSGASQAPGGSYFHREISMEAPDFQWNGRHGGSLMGVKGLRIVGGNLRNNGKHAPGHSPDVRSGGMARMFNGGPFGRPWDCESELPGEGFEDILFRGVDMRDNAGGMLFHHVRWPGHPLARNISVQNCRLSDPSGQTTGDGALIFFGVDATTGKPFRNGTMVYDGVYALDNQYERHGVSVYNANHVRISGGHANITGPGFWGYYAMAHQCGDDIVIDVRSNRPHIWRANGDQGGVISSPLYSKAKRRSS